MSDIDSWVIPRGQITYEGPFIESFRGVHKNDLREFVHLDGRKLTLKFEKNNMNFCVEMKLDDRVDVLRIREDSLSVEIKTERLGELPVVNFTVIVDGMTDTGLEVSIGREQFEKRRGDYFFPLHWEMVEAAA